MAKQEREFPTYLAQPAKGTRQAGKGGLKGGSALAGGLSAAGGLVSKGLGSIADSIWEDLRKIADRMFWGK